MEGKCPNLLITAQNTGSASDQPRPVPPPPDQHLRRPRGVQCGAAAAISAGAHGKLSSKLILPPVRT